MGGGGVGVEWLFSGHNERARETEAVSEKERG